MDGDLSSGVLGVLIYIVRTVQDSVAFVLGVTSWRVVVHISGYRGFQFIALGPIYLRYLRKADLVRIFDKREICLSIALNRHRPCSSVLTSHSLAYIVIPYHSIGSRWETLRECKTDRR